MRGVISRTPDGIGLNVGRLHLYLTRYWRGVYGTAYKFRHNGAMYLYAYICIGFLDAGVSIRIAKERTVVK